MITEVTDTIKCPATDVLWEKTGKGGDSASQ